MVQLVHEDKKREEEHKKLVPRLISGGGRGAGFFHRLPRTSSVERGLQVLEELEERAKPMRRCEEKRKSGRSMDSAISRGKA